MDNQIAKTDFWMRNPNLKTLLLVLIFVFLISGIGLTVFTVWSNNYRQQVYEQTQAGLPKHEVKATTTSSNLNGWKIYTDQESGFTIEYPNDWLVVNPSPGCCVAISQTNSKSFLNVYNEVDYIKAQNILNVQAFADREQLINRQEINSQNANEIIGDAPISELGGVEYRHQYLFINANHNASLVDISTCEETSGVICDQIARTFKFTK